MSTFANMKPPSTFVLGVVAAVALSFTSGLVGYNLKWCPEPPLPDFSDERDSLRQAYERKAALEKSRFDSTLFVIRLTQAARPTLENRVSNALRNISGLSADSIADGMLADPQR